MRVKWLLPSFQTCLIVSDDPRSDDMVCKSRQDFLFLSHLVLRRPAFRLRDFPVSKIHGISVGPSSLLARLRRWFNADSCYCGAHEFEICYCRNTPAGNASVRSSYRYFRTDAGFKCAQRSGVDPPVRADRNVWGHPVSFRNGIWKLVHGADSGRSGSLENDDWSDAVRQPAHRLWN